MRNGKNWIVLFFSSMCVAIVFAFGILLFIVCAGGCSTTIGKSYDIVNTNSRILGRIETTIEDFDIGVATALERSQKFENELERIDYLFGQYERLVIELRDEVNCLRAEIKNKGEDNLGSGDSNFD